jgi:integrase/recombinase XerD
MKTQKHQITISQAMNGYLIAAGARHLSDHTIKDYQNTFKKFKVYIGPDVPFDSISQQDIEAFMSSFTGLRNKTLLNYHTGLAALWTWAVREKLVTTHIVHGVTAPRPEKREIIPFTEAEFKAMLAATARSKAYARPGKRKSDHSLPDSDRMRAILLMLLDTGLRASELCDLKIFQVDQRNQRVQVMGKGARERSIPFSPRTAQALWRYLTSRPDASTDEHVFVTSLGRPMERRGLADMLESLGLRAGIKGVHPHRFRHTFAIQYLRNGGDPYTLQILLGHSELDMVKTYLRLAQIDLDQAHKRASPVDNWSL